MSSQELVPLNVLNKVQNAMSAYFTVLCRMPHMTKYSYRHAPEQGWPLDQEALKAFGKTEETIDVLRHLPCLVVTDPSEDRPAPITCHSKSIAFHEGKIWDSYHHDICITPEHVVLIALPPLRHDYYLLLDTKLGSITEYGAMQETMILRPYEKYEALPDADKWMAHSTMSAEDFFGRESQRLERLVYMPIPTTHGDHVCYYRALSANHEAELLAVEDEEWGSERGQRERDLDYDDGSGSETEDSDDSDQNKDEEISDNELDALLVDTETYSDQPGASLGIWKPPVTNPRVQERFSVRQNLHRLYYCDE